MSSTHRHPIFARVYPYISRAAENGGATEHRRALLAGLRGRVIEVGARGSSNKEIAVRLCISVKTVGNHVEHIYMKIDASSRAQASLFAMRHGLL